MKPLEGITIVEFSTMITASFAAMMLGEQGARVIKVEPLELGDPMRFLGSSKGGISALFANFNRGKESVRIDLKKDEGKQIVRDLAARADIVLCNFRPGIMDKLGLGADALRAINPRLIYAGVTGFGLAGPDRDKPAYDPVIQAQAGLTAAQGRDNPEFVRNLICDKITAYTACQAVTAALYVREKTGEGQRIDLSMMDAGLFYIFPDAFMHHTLHDTDGVDHQPPLADILYELTVTKDGAITVSAATDQQRVGLLMACEQIHLMADERFNTMDKLIANLTEFRDLVSGAIGQIETDELLARLKEQNVPASKCLSYEEVLAHPQYAANDSIETIDHPIMGSMRQVRAPARFHGEQLEPGGPAPAHGQHTASVLAELGRDAGEFERLKELGAVL